MKQLKNVICAVSLGLAASSHADVLLNFPFNEGSGATTTDTASGLAGLLGTVQDPAVDKADLVDASPSGQAGDRAIETFGGGFLLAEDTNDTLAITNGPITLETWVYIDPNTPAKAAEGFLAYGNSYKLGLRGGKLVFTLFGVVDVENPGDPILAGQWVHVAAVWEPGVGVRFHVNDVETFVEETRLARPALHNYLSLASEGLGNNSVARYDRMRIHHAALGAEEIDKVAATPKPAFANTLVNYQFNQSALPATNSIVPVLPTVQSHALLPVLTGPKWTNDTPSGLTNDYALAFLAENPPVREVVTVNFDGTPVDLAVNNTNYTLQAWIKMPNEPLEERRVILRTDGNGPRIALSINANRTLHTTVVGTADFTTSVLFPNDERWHHVAVVMEDFARLRFYLDGVLRQTVNRTQTGAPTSGGTPRLLIGKESEARYFRGILDRVIINNNALTAAELDYPARPGMPHFAAAASHPTNVLTTAGSTVSFTAAPTGGTGQQWFYRSNAWELPGVALAGQTGTSLTLSNVSAANEGYYYLLVTNATGAVASAPARLTLQSRFSRSSIGFEAPDYIAGLPIDDQDVWTTDFNGNATRVLTAAQIQEELASAGIIGGDPVHSGNQAFVASGPALATTTIRRINGFENSSNVVVEVWTRPLQPGNTGAPIGNLFLTVENAAGRRAAAFRLGPANSLDWAGPTTAVWEPSGIAWETNTWYNIRFEIDYAARTYDMFVNGNKANPTPLPFYQADADRFAQIRIFRGAGQAGAIFDDLSISTPGQVQAPELSVRRQAETLTITWPATATGFTLQATEKLAPANWTTVTHTTTGAENLATVPISGTSRFFRLVRAN